MGGQQSNSRSCGPFAGGGDTSSPTDVFGSKQKSTSKADEARISISKKRRGVNMPKSRKSSAKGKKTSKGYTQPTLASSMKARKAGKELPRSVLDGRRGSVDSVSSNDGGGERRGSIDSVSSNGMPHAHRRLMSTEERLMVQPVGVSHKLVESALQSKSPFNSPKGTGPSSVSRSSSKKKLVKQPSVPTIHENKDTYKPLEAGDAEQPATISPWDAVKAGEHGEFNTQAEIMMPEEMSMTEPEPSPSLRPNTVYKNPFDKTSPSLPANVVDSPALASNYGISPSMSANTVSSVESNSSQVSSSIGPFDDPPSACSPQQKPTPSPNDAVPRLSREEKLVSAAEEIIAKSLKAKLQSSPKNIMQPASRGSTSSTRSRSKSNPKRKKKVTRRRSAKPSKPRAASTVTSSGRPVPKTLEAEVQKEIKTHERQISQAYEALSSHPVGVPRSKTPRR